MSVVMNRLGRLLLALGALTACGPERGEDGGDGAPGWMVGTFSNRWPGFARTDLGLWDIRADGTIDQTYVSQCGDYERPGEPLRWSRVDDGAIEILDSDGQPWIGDRYLLAEGDACDHVVGTLYVNGAPSPRPDRYHRGKVCIVRSDVQCPSGYQCDTCFTVACDEADEDAQIHTCNAPEAP